MLFPSRKERDVESSKNWREHSALGLPWGCREEMCITLLVLAPPAVVFAASAGGLLTVRWGHFKACRVLGPPY